MNSLDSYDILVIILSITLAVFLVLAIISMIYVIRITKQISNITDKAGKVVDNIEAVGKAATSNGPMSFISGIITSVIENSMNEDKKEANDE